MTQLAKTSDSTATGETMNAAPELLRVQGVRAGYGLAQVLFGVDLSVREGMAVSLLGRNGMGKTTLVKCLFGLLPLTEGRILFAGEDLSAASTGRRARAGLALAPEGRRIFANLTTEENLLAFARPARWSESWDLARVYELFPELRARRHASGALLSGGEQQMLAIGRALMTNPRLLVLDEATEGLSPRLRERIWRALAEVRNAGVALLVIDKHLHDLMELCEQHCIMVKGQIVWRGDSAALRADAESRERHLGV